MDCENGISRLAKENSAKPETDAYKRLSFLFDGGVYTEIDRFAKNGDAGCGVVAAYGNVNGAGTYAYSQDVTEFSGAMNRAQAAKIAKVYDLALKNGCPVVGIFDSKGAFADDGVDALNAYGELIAAAGRLSGVVPMISVVAGACVGSAAVLANIADATVMTENAELCLRSSAVTGNGKVGTAQSAAKSGLADVIAADDSSAMESVAAILAALPSNNLSVPSVADYVPAASSGDGMDASVSSVIDENSFFELLAEYGKCAKVGFARIAGESVGVVAAGGYGNDDRICGEGASKIARFVRLCDAYSLPVVTFIDCAGFMGDGDEELGGSLKAVSALTAAYSEATTAKVSIITGKAYGLAYTALAGKASGTDVAIALADAAICALEPMTAVQFLYKDRLGNEKREDLEKEYALCEGSPLKAAENGDINAVVTSEDLTQSVIAALDMLASKRVSTLDKKHSNLPIYR